MTDGIVSAKDSTIVDGTAIDAGTDATSDGEVDAAACTLPAADPDAGVSGTLQWALRFGVTGYTYPTTVARAPANGDIVVTGYFWGTTDFGGGPLVSQAPMDGSGSDVFVARFDKSGGYKWAHAWGNGLSTVANSIAVDTAGNVVLAGVFRGRGFDLGGGPLPGVGNSDVFLVKLDAAGNYQWGKSFGTVGEYSGLNSVAVDSAGNLVVAGGGTSLDLGGGPLTGFILAKFNAAGGHSWSKGFSASTTYGGPWLAVDGQGNAILAGSFRHSIDLGGGPLNTPGADSGDGTNAAFTAKFDPSGRHLWSRQFGQGAGGKNTSVTGVAADACGNIVLHGPFSGTATFGAGTLTSVPSKSNAFLAKLAPSGMGIWSSGLAGANAPGVGALGFGGIGLSGAGGVTLTPVLLGGIGYQSTADFGGGPLTGNSGSGAGAMTIATFDSIGAHRWSYVAGAPSTARVSAAASPVGVAGWGSSVVVAGVFATCSLVCATSPPGTTLVLAGNTFTAVSGQDLFIASFAP